LLFAIVTGCHASSDPCAAFAGQTCIDVEIHAGTSGIAAVDQILLSSPELKLVSTPSPPDPEPANLPVAVPILCGAFTGTYTLSVHAQKGGNEVAAAVLGDQMIGTSEHRRVVVELAPPTQSSPFTVVQGRPIGESINAIWGADAEHIFAVGTNGLHDDYVAGTWLSRTTAQGRTFYSVWGFDAGEVYAVGELEADGRGVIERFDGSGWREEYLAPSGIHGIWSDHVVVLAVGADGQIYGKAVGSTSWAPRLGMPLVSNPDFPRDPATPVLYGISGNGGSDWVMPAGRDRFYHYEGMGNFVNLDPVADQTIDFRAVWAAPGNTTNVFLGTNYFGIIWLNAGGSPPNAPMLDDQAYQLNVDQSQPGNGSMFIRGIWSDGARAVFVGDAGHIYTYDVGSDNVSPVLSPTTTSLGGVWASSPSDVWIVGDRELILHGSIGP
jgi:hypothetical protein